MKDGLTQVKELKDKIHEQYIEIQELELDLQQTNSQLANVSKRCIEAIKYIEKQVHRNQQFYEMDKDNLLDILKGADKE